jgi:uncharacterized BrkB/YihY/UPF0761 family membrane protein
MCYNGAKSGFLNKIFAAKERKEHMDKNLCCLFFAIFAIFCGQFILVATLPLWAIRGQILKPQPRKFWVRIFRVFRGLPGFSFSVI